MFVQSLLLHLHIDFDVGVRRIKVHVIEPSLNNRKIYSGLEQMHCGCMAKRMWPNFFGF